MWVRLKGRRVSDVASKWQAFSFPSINLSFLPPERLGEQRMYFYFRCTQAFSNSQNRSIIIIGETNHTEESVFHCIAIKSPREEFRSLLLLGCHLQSVLGFPLIFRSNFMKKCESEVYLRNRNTGSLYHGVESTTTAWQRRQWMRDFETNDKARLKYNSYIRYLFLHCNHIEME